MESKYGMTVIQLAEDREVVAKFNAIRPGMPRRIPQPVKVAPRTNNGGLVGTAFDYFLRFEIQRRAPYAASAEWIAEEVLIVLAEDAGRQARRVIDDARGAVAAYVAKGRGNAREIVRDQPQIARHAIRLARLDTFRRSGILDPSMFAEPDLDDVDDLVAMLAIVPLEEFLNKRPLILNPSFGDSSTLVGGADADLFVGETLIDLSNFCRRST